MDLAERIAPAAHVLEAQVQARARQQFAGAEQVGAGLPQAHEDLQGRGGVGHGDEGRLHVRRQREQLQAGRGDDAQRAFGADEQVPQGVAGVVLAQRSKTVPDAAIGQHHLQAQHQLARVAVAQHLDAAGVGRQVAADPAAAFGAERQRKQQARAPRGLLQRRQHAPGLHRHREVVAIDGAHAGEAFGRHDDAGRAAGRHAAAAHAGVAPLGHDRHPGLGTQRDHGRHLGRRARPDHGLRLAAKQAPGLDQVRLERSRIDPAVSRSEQRLQVLDQAVQVVGVGRSLKVTPLYFAWLKTFSRCRTSIASGKRKPQAIL